MLSYFNGKYLPKDQISISPDDRGFLFADALYEVMRSYSGCLFQAEAHIERLNYGAREIRLNTTEFSYLTEVAQHLIEENHLTKGDALIYIQVSRGVASRGHQFPSQNTPLTVYATIQPFTPLTDALENRTSVVFVTDMRWARADIKSVSLLPNVLAMQQANDAGATEAILIRDGSVTEGTKSNFFAVTEGTVITRPRTNYSLGGIARQVIIGLCK